MTPYYSDDLVTIYHGDCRDVLLAIEPEVAEAVVTDPPYGETSLEWDRVVPGWTVAAGRALKPSGSMWVFGSMRSFIGADLGGWKFAQDVVWEKHNGSNFHADRFRRVHEHACHFYMGEWKAIYAAPVTTPDATKRAMRRKRRPAHTGNIGAAAYATEDGGPRLMRSVIYVRSCHGEAEHPTQKPVGILSPLIEYSCPPGGIVLDPFLGSGSTLVAAKQLGRRGIGVETKERYCEVAAKRLSQGVLTV